MRSSIFTRFTLISLTFIFPHHCLGDTRGLGAARVNDHPLQFFGIGGSFGEVLRTLQQRIVDAVHGFDVLSQQRGRVSGRALAAGVVPDVQGVGLGAGGCPVGQGGAIRARGGRVGQFVGNVYAGL